MYRICHEAGGHKTIFTDSSDYLIGMSGAIYENYGKSWSQPFWEQVYDSTVFVQWSTRIKTKGGIELYEGDIIQFPQGSIWFIKRIGASFMRIGPGKWTENLYDGLDVKVIGNTFFGEPYA